MFTKPTWAPGNVPLLYIYYSCIFDFRNAFAEDPNVGYNSVSGEFNHFIALLELGMRTD